MTTIQKYITIMLACFVLNSSYAQEQVDRNVTIEREFQPVIQDAGKIMTLPELMQANTAKERVDYTEIYQPLPFEKNIVILSAEEVLHKRRRESKEAFVRLGAGNYWNTMGDIALPIIKNNKNRLDLLLKHTGTFGEKQHAFSRANLGYNHYFNRYDLYAGLGFSHQYFNYYGNNFYGTQGKTTDLKAFSSLLSVPQPKYMEQNLERITRSAQIVKLDELANSPLFDMLWRYNAHVGIRSLPNATGKKYHAELAYDFFKSDNGLKENIIDFQYGFSNPVGDNRFGMDFELSNLFYQETDTAKINFWDYYAVFSMNPYFLMERDSWYLRAGVKTAFSFIHGRPFNPTPDITAEWRVLPKVLSVYGGVTGDFKLSTLSSIYEENPYVYSDLRVKDTYTPINTYFGFKLKPLHNLLLDAFIDYRYIVDQYFFVNKAYFSTEIPGDYATLFTNRFNAVYSDAGLFRIGMRANYNFKNTVNVQLKGVYNGWDVKNELHAWLQPAFEADVSADVRIGRNLTATAQLFYEGERYAQLGIKPFKMDPKVDVNLGATYTFNRTLSAFAKLNNLLNSKYQQFYGYEVQGINFMLGGAVSF